MLSHSSFVASLAPGKTHSVKLRDFDHSAAIFIQALTEGAQADVRSSLVKSGAKPTVSANVLGASFQGKIVRVLVPATSPNGPEPYVFVDCKSGNIAVQVLGSGPFQANRE